MKANPAAVIEPVLALLRPSRKKTRRLDHILATRLETTGASATALRQAVRSGQCDFVLSSRDGRIAARVRLSILEAGETAHDIGEGTLVVDWGRGIVGLRDAQVRLSRTELRLLAALFDGAGKPVSRKQLIARVWPNDDLPAADRANALAVYVCSLRKRLGTIGAGSALVTVRRQGYRLHMK